MYSKLIEPYIKEYINELDKSIIVDIIDYSMKDGKCIRGFIVKHLMNIISNNELDFWENIVIVEIINTVSLILDDLPCMDNDKYRRNKLCTHLKFGESESILTSFYMISEVNKLFNKFIEKISCEYDEIKVKKIENIYKKINEKFTGELVLGQLLDLKKDAYQFVNYKVDEQDVDLLTMIYKTGTLFSLCFVLGGSISILYDKEFNLEDYKKMGESFGIMYQIMDDFKDYETDKEETNYVRKVGRDKALRIYKSNKSKLEKLLEDNGIMTEELNELINVIDKNLNMNL